MYIKMQELWQFKCIICCIICMAVAQFIWPNINIMRNLQNNDMQIQYDQLINCLSANAEKIHVCCQLVTAGDAHWICILQCGKFKKGEKMINYILSPLMAVRKYWKVYLNS